MKKYDYTIGIFNTTSVRIGHETYHTTNFVTVVNGDRIEFDGGCWYLWNNNTVVTSGPISGLSVRKVRRNVAIYDDVYDFIEYRYTAYDEISL